MYATGLSVTRDQSKALLYHTFAAHGGETTAEMTMGYRYLLGIGTDEKCEDALYHYKNVATKVIDYYLSGPPGGHTPPLSKVRLSEETGGVFGYGASVTTEKRPRQHGASSEKSVSIDEILQYWKYLAAKQDVDAQLMLGQVYYLGTRSVSRNFDEAYNYFFQIVDKIPNNGKIPAKNSKAIGQAAGYLGLMYWRGEGVEVDAKIAYKWFSIGVDLNDAVSQNALGMMYLDGIVVPKNREKAIEYFKKSADQENPNAQVNLAIEYAQTEANLPLAIRLFAKAADAKHLLAFWYLAHMNEQNIIPRPSCRVAVSVSLSDIGWMRMKDVI
jgi:SEL1 protein